jgi:uncharacterized membrane protein YhaH (DUF805 family)
LKEIWFRRKTYGWGWTPANRKGWTVVLIFLVLTIGGTVYWINMGTFELYPYMAFIILMNILLVILCWAKGEKPQWQWGNKDKNE